MAYTKDKAIELAKSFLKKASKRYPIESAFLFGSYARGTQRDYSDIDIAVVLGGIMEPCKYSEKAFELFHEAQEYNSLLEIICLKEEEFENDSEAIINQIKEEGIRIDF